MDYSSFARWCDNAIEELLDGLSEEAIEELRTESAGLSLQKILLQSDSNEVFDYISKTKRQRTTLKKFGPDKRRNRLALESILHLQVVRDSLEDLERLNPAMKPNDLLSEMLFLRQAFVFPRLKGPGRLRSENAQSLRNALRGLGLS